ncbi:MAG: PaaI family thioesterase [Desulfobacteraceae bacterium]|nr:MAG: PaaI family thioesterase [Desulfobacteraceae bacterium]
MSTLNEHIQSSRRTGAIEFIIEERSADCVTSRMPVQEGILNPFGVVQAGALLWLADVTASVLVLEAQPADDRGEGFPLAIDLHTCLFGNQRDGAIRAEARFVRQGRRVSVVRTRILGKDSKLLAEVTSTHVPAR